MIEYTMTLKHKILTMFFIVTVLLLPSCASDEPIQEGNSEKSTIAENNTENEEGKDDSADPASNVLDENAEKTGTEETAGMGNEDPSPSIYQNAMDMIYNGRYETALNLLNEYLEYHPESTDAMNAIGYSYYKIGNNGKAETWYRQSIETNPENAEPYRHLGKIYTETRKYQSAINMFSALIEIEDDDPDGYFGLGLVYNKVNMYEDSLTYLDRAIQYYLKNNSVEAIEAYYLQGINYYYTGQTENAFSYLSAIEEYYLDDVNLRKILIDIREQLKRSD